MTNPVKELIPPEKNSFMEELKLRKKQLIQLLRYKQNCLKSAPEGGLRIISNKGCRQYYFRNTKDSSSSGKYIPKNKMPLVRRLAQKYYDYRIIPLIRQQIKWISRIEQTQPPHLSTLFNSLESARQTLITPVTLTDTQYAEEWLATKYVHKSFPPDALFHQTNRGERVRSKSEVMIANELLRAGIPYRYEFPVEVTAGFAAGGNVAAGAITFHPDFYCLNLATRQEVIWEHLGMCDSGEYAVKALSRLALYQQNGWHPGKNLILTFETQTCPLTVQTIRKVINRYFAKT